jgi:hypothetical protein
MALPLFDIVKKKNGRFGMPPHAIARAKESQWAAPVAQVRRGAQRRRPPAAAPWPPGIPADVSRETRRRA